VCGPLFQQVAYGQLNLILLALFAGIWVADRSGRPWLAGALLGLATTLKLFPGFLFLYFALRRRWQTVGAGIVTVGVLTGVTAAVLGVETFASYVQEVMPEVAQFRSEWLNASVAGFWAKLFNPSGRAQFQILFHCPLLAQVATAVCDVVVLAVVARVIWRSRTSAETDLAFALTLVGMLLVSPICWDHYLVLLLFPLALLWKRLSRSGLDRWLFRIILVVIWLPPTWFWDAFIPGGRNHGIPTPLQTVTVLSLHFYALLGLFFLLVWVNRSHKPEAPARAPLSSLALRACVELGSSRGPPPAPHPGQQQ
jgi:hypothetical protein